MIKECPGCIEKQGTIGQLQHKLELRDQTIEQLVKKLRLGGLEEEAEEYTQPGGASAGSEQENEQVVGAADSDKSSSELCQRHSGAAPAPEEEREKTVESKSKPGHGRIRADEYRVERTVICKDERTGDRCPREGCGGRLYDTSQPQRWIRFEGRPPVSASRYEQQVLRCSRCQGRYTARLPAGVRAEKYDATADAIIALMKYGAGMPWYRLSRLQQSMGVPLPASTQFERCSAIAEAVRPVYLELEKESSGGQTIHFDDTGIKILACLRENEDLGAGERKGLHTTGVVALAGVQKIALYYSGRRHAGENLAELMRKRPPGLDPPIVMADAEAKNWTTEFGQVVAKCLQHGRRRFTEVKEEFPIECGRVLDDLAAVYRNEAAAQGMSPTERLLYHQRQSAPILAGLRQWIETQFDHREVEPNSGLGRAMRYLLKHWDGLTRFLEVEGAPLDNNLAERALKRVVLHRKNALFYKTQNGAAVGDILMSLIQTCSLNNVNPFDYLVALVRNAGAVRINPTRWLPWRYQEQEIKAA